MLQKLNERIQGVIAWLVISLIAITFTLFGVDYYMQSHRNADVKALVNNEAISLQAFENNYRRIRSQREVMNLTLEREKKLKNDILESMISNDVAMQNARKFGFEVSPDQANAAIVSIPQFQEDGHFSASRYQQALTGALFTPTTFQQEVRQGMLLNQQRFAFMGSAFVLPYELERFVKLYMQTRDYDYLLIPASMFNKDMHITEETLRNYYTEHAGEFLSPEKVRIEYVKLSLPAIRATLKVTPEDILQSYNENKGNYLMPAQWQVAHILFEVPADSSPAAEQVIKKKAEDIYATLKEKPDQFKELTKTLSKDKAIENNGLLPWIVAGQTEWDRHLIHVTQPGSITAPIKTAKGYEILKLVDYKPAQNKPLSEVSSAIKEQLLNEKAQKQYTHLLEELSDLSYQTPESLSSVSEALKMPIQISPFFTRKGGEDSLTKNSSVVHTAFSHDVLNSGNNSEPVQLDPESVIVLRVNKHIPATTESFDKVKPRIVSTLTKKHSMLQAKKWGDALIQSTPEAQKMLSKSSLEWKPVQRAMRDADNADPLINALAYSIPKVHTKIGQTTANGDYVLVHLKSINPGSMSALDKERRDSIAQQMEANYGMMDYDLYLVDSIKHAKIEKY